MLTYRRDVADPRQEQTRARTFAVKSGEQLFKHLYLNLPDTEMLKSGF